MDMHAAYKELGSYRAAAKLCGTTDKTVKRAVARGTSVEEGTKGAVAVEHNHDDVAAIIAKRVEKTQGMITAKRLLPMVRADWFACGYPWLHPLFQGEEPPKHPAWFTPAAGDEVHVSRRAQAAQRP